MKLFGISLLLIISEWERRAPWWVRVSEGASEERECTPAVSVNDRRTHQSKSRVESRVNHTLALNYCSLSVWQRNDASSSDCTDSWQKQEDSSTQDSAIYSPSIRCISKVKSVYKAERQSTEMRIKLVTLSSELLPGQSHDDTHKSKVYCHAGGNWV